MLINAVSPVKFQNYAGMTGSNISFSGAKKNINNAKTAKADDNMIQEKDILFVKNKVALSQEKATEILNKSKKEYMRGMGIIKEAIDVTPAYMKGEGKLKIAHKPWDIMDAKSKNMVVTSPNHNIIVEYTRNGDMIMRKEDYTVSLLNRKPENNNSNKTLVIEKTNLNDPGVIFSTEQYNFDDYLNTNSFSYVKLSKQFKAKGGEIDNCELNTDNKGYLKSYKDKDINIDFYNKNSDATVNYKGKNVHINLITDEIEVK